MENEKDQLKEIEKELRQFCHTSDCESVENCPQLAKSIAVELAQLISRLMDSANSESYRWHFHKLFFATMALFHVLERSKSRHKTLYELVYKLYGTLLSIPSAL